MPEYNKITPEKMTEERYRQELTLAFIQSAVIERYDTADEIAAYINKRVDAIIARQK